MPLGDRVSSWRDAAAAIEVSRTNDGDTRADRGTRVAPEALAEVDDPHASAVLASPHDLTAVAPWKERPRPLVEVLVRGADQPADRDMADLTRTSRANASRKHRPLAPPRFPRPRHGPRSEGGELRRVLDPARGVERQGRGRGPGAAAEIRCPLWFPKSAGASLAQEVRIALIAQELTHAYQESVREEPARIAQFLQATLGQKLTAYAVGVRDPRAIGHYTRGREPRDDTLVRLRDLFEITRLLVAHESPATVRAWMIGSNPQLGDYAPIELLHDDDVEPVFTAADAFLTAG
jgi:signal transduction histidine kinase